MVSALQQKYLLVTLSAQVMLSIINTLFILSDLGVVLALLGFWGLVQGSVPVLLFFAVSQSLSIAMDVVRLVLWGPFILSNILQIPATLGTFYLVLTAFGITVKLVATIFSLMVRRELQLWARDPNHASTVKRGGSSWLQIIPDLQIPGPRSTVDIESLQPPLEKSGRDAQPSLMRPTEETRLLDERIAVDEPSSAAKKEATPRTEGFQYESFGGGPMRGGAQ